ncbi:MAG: right-handed parallel beta-helix repeat-containing protein [Kiritimatiellae bacterium]|nr:right-handed parallel beta-helix repeat-containing protein [Kiritimatiellia bacterium]
MKRYLHLTVWSVFFAVMAKGAEVLHVAPDGNDANPGTRERPLATWQGARDAVRAFKAKNGGRVPPGGVSVEFAEGVWKASGALSLSSADSGEPGAPVTWRARNRGKAVLSGRTDLQWRVPAADEAPLLPEKARAHVRAASVPGTEPLPGFTGGGCIHTGLDRYEHPVSLFEGDMRLVPARWPDEGFHTLPPGTECPPGTWLDGTVDFPSPRLADWAKEKDLWVCGLWNRQYAENVTKALSVDPVKGVFTVDQPFDKRGKSAMPQFHVLNAFSELDRPGEWAVDRAARRIYAWPLKERGSPALAFTGHLLVVSNAAHVVFEGFIFEHARWDALVFARCTNAVLAASCVRHTSAWGVNIAGGRDCRVEGCDLYDIGEGGIRLEGGEQGSLAPANHAADNCHIRDYGKVIWNYRPGVGLFGVGCRAAHNLIHHSLHQGVSFEGNDHYVGFNVIHDTCRHNNDAGAVYGYMENWTGRGTTIEYNCIHMTGNQPRAEHIMGIYLDAYTSDVTVRGNIVNRCPIALFSSGGQGNVIEKNVVLNSQLPIRRWNLGLMGKDKKPFSGAERGYKSGRFTGLQQKLDSPHGALWRARYPTIAKLFAAAEKEGPAYAHNALFTTFRDNLIVACAEPTFADLEFTRDYTTITNNLPFEGDPGFTDYFGMDWTLKPDAPARKILGGDTRFAEMGLYAHAKRFSPPVKFAPDVTPPRKLQTEYNTPVARLDVEACGNAPNGETLFADGLVNCRLMGSRKARRVEAGFGPASWDGWKECSFSFVPRYDCEADVLVLGANGEKTAYDDVRADGLALADGGFEQAGVWHVTKPGTGTAQWANCREPYGITDGGGVFAAAHGKQFALSHHLMNFRQRVKLKKGVRVTISFRARAWTGN